jgi:Zn-dependent protease
MSNAGAEPSNEPEIRFSDWVDFFQLGRVARVLAFLVIMSLITSFDLALMLTIIIAVHEAGHLLALRRADIQPRRTYDVPLLGALIRQPDEVTNNRPIAALMALSGSAAGLLLVVLSEVLCLIDHAPALALFAGLAALVNFLNLLPFYPLDGGRVLQAMRLSLGVPHAYAFAWTRFLLIEGLLLFWQFRMAAALLIIPGFISTIVVAEKQVKYKRRQLRVPADRVDQSVLMNHRQVLKVMAMWFGLAVILLNGVGYIGAHGVHHLLNQLL